MKPKISFSNGIFTRYRPKKIDVIVTRSMCEEIIGPLNTLTAYMLSVTSTLQLQASEEIIKSAVAAKERLSVVVSRAICSYIDPNDLEITSISNNYIASCFLIELTHTKVISGVKHIWPYEIQLGNNARATVTEAMKALHRINNPKMTEEQISDVVAKAFKQLR